MKRLVALTLSVLMAGSLLTGCTASESNASDTNSGGEGEKVQIRIMTRASGTQPFDLAFQDMVKKFQEENPDIEIIDESISDEGSYNDKLKTDIASGDLPDLFRIQGSVNLKPYIESGLIMNVDEILESDPEWASGFAEGSFDKWRFDDIEGTYGIPFESYPMGFFYNTELFEQAGITETPETWTEFLDCIEKLKAIGVTPISLGSKDIWRAGHMQNAIMYRYCGVQKVIDIGSREAKWTDPEVVEAWQKFADLVNMGAFTPNSPGVSYEQDKTDFLSGKAAMNYDGAYFVGEVAESELDGKVSVFPFPSFEEKPEYADNYRQTLNAYLLNAKTEGAEKEALIKFVKFITVKEASQYYVDKALYGVPRTDVEIDPATVGQLYTDLMALNELVKVPGSDAFDYDPISSMQDVTRNAAVSIFLGTSPEEACQTIQAEIEDQEG